MTAGSLQATLTVGGIEDSIACRVPTEDELAVTRVPAAVRCDERFRAGYNLGYGQASYETSQKNSARGRPSTYRGEPGKAQIEDVTELTSSQAVTTIPCCGRTLRLSRGRPRTTKRYQRSAAHAGRCIARCSYRKSPTATTIPPLGCPVHQYAGRDRRQHSPCWATGIQEESRDAATTWQPAVDRSKTGGRVP